MDGQAEGGAGAAGGGDKRKGGAAGADENSSKKAKGANKIDLSSEMIRFILNASKETLMAWAEKKAPAVSMTPKQLLANLMAAAAFKERHLKLQSSRYATDAWLEEKMKTKKDLLSLAGDDTALLAVARELLPHLQKVHGEDEEVTLEDALDALESVVSMLEDLAKGRAKQLRNRVWVRAWLLAKGRSLDYLATVAGSDASLRAAARELHEHLGDTRDAGEARATFEDALGALEFVAGNLANLAGGRATQLRWRSWVRTWQADSGRSHAELVLMAGSDARLRAEGEAMCASINAMRSLGSPLLTLDDVLPALEFVAGNLATLEAGRATQLRYRSLVPLQLMRSLAGVGDGDARMLAAIAEVRARMGGRGSNAAQDAAALAAIRCTRGQQAPLDAHNSGRAAAANDAKNETSNFAASLFKK